MTANNEVSVNVPVGTPAVTSSEGAATSAQEAKLVLVELGTLPQPAKEAAERYVQGERVAWRLEGTTQGQRGGVVTALGKRRGIGVPFTLPTEGDRHFLVAKSSDMAKVEEVVSKVFAHVQLTPQQRAAALRERLVGRMVAIPLPEQQWLVARVFPTFATRMNLGKKFKDKAVVYPEGEGKEPFYFKRWREEEGVTLPDPATWVLLFEFQACWWFLLCCKLFFGKFGEALGGVRPYSVLRQFAPRSGLPPLVYVAKDKDDKGFLEQMVPNPVLALCGYDVREDELDGKTPVADIAKLYKPPSKDEDFDFDEAFEIIRNSQEQKTIREAQERADRRAAAAAVLAGTATANSFAVLQEEDVGPSSAPPPQDPKEFPVLGAPAPQRQGVWAARGGGNPQPSA